MSETQVPEDEDEDVTFPSESDGEVTAPTDDDSAVQEIARSHPSAGSDSEPEGVEQQDNTEGTERAADGGPGAGVDYAGSGY